MITYKIKRTGSSILTAVTYLAVLVGPKIGWAGCSSTVLSDGAPTASNVSIKFNDRVAAQTFKAPGTGCIAFQSVTFSVEKSQPGNSGSFGALIVQLYTTSAGVPNSPISGATTVADTSSLSINGGLADVTATFSSPVSLVGGATYAIVFSSPASIGDASYKLGILDDSYADGEYYDHNANGGGPWHAPSQQGTTKDVKMSLCFVPCSTGGCTLTQGYWKNHPAVWPVSSLTLGTVSYSEAELLTILHQPVVGNGLLSLAHQLIAAKLNIAAGADGSALGTEIADADALIGSLVVPSIGTGYLAPSTTSTFVAILDSFNQGLIGPGHCPE